jgi:hypothetical protein
MKQAIAFLEILVYVVHFQSVRMMIQYMKESLAHKLKRERVEVCLHCKKFVRCDNIGKFVECASFEEAGYKV